MAKRIWMTGGRGGVGTGFCTVNIALALARAQKRVLLVDGNPLCRSLDAILSCSEDVVYDLSDLCAGRIGAKDLLLFPPRGEGLALIPGVFRAGDMPSAAKLRRSLDALADEFDFILLDAPALPSLLSGTPHYDICCVVADPSSAALRGAEKIGVSLREAGAPEVRLLINRFSLLPPCETGQRTALSMVDAAHIQLLGLIPPVGEDELARIPYTEEYPLLCEKHPYKRDRARLAFINIAARLMEKEIPLLAGMRALRFRRRELLY